MGRVAQLVDVCVIGGGQSALAVGYHLRRAARRSAPGLAYVLLDDRPRPGGAWQDAWDSLHLFSPAEYSSLPGWQMPPWTGEDNPDATHVVRYLAGYEDRYDLPVERPVDVVTVHPEPDAGANGRLVVTAADGRAWSAGWLVNATGTWRRPFWPYVPGSDTFAGRQLHTVDYRAAADFADRRVLVVGGGNSGAQIAADLLPVAASVTWATKAPPRLLPDDVDGRVLFETATRAVQHRAAGLAHAGVSGLGDVVAVPSVRYARDHLGLRAEPMVERLVPEGAQWPDGRRRPYDVVIWCTGFRPALRHLAPLGLSTRHGRPRTVAPAEADPTSTVVSADDARVLFVGYGDWSGAASATLVGVNRAARAAVAAISTSQARRE